MVQLIACRIDISPVDIMLIIDIREGCDCLVMVPWRSYSEAHATLKIHILVPEARS